jgi:hypothetical protein
MMLRFGTFYMGIMLNCVVIVDLYLTLRNPFYPRNKRIVPYSTIVVVFMLTLFYGIFNHQSIFGEQKDHIKKIKTPQFIPLFYLLLSVTVISFVAAVKRLFRRGTSK